MFMIPDPSPWATFAETIKRLEIGCLNCNRHEYVDANSIKLPDDYPVPKIADRLRCSRCGFRNSATSAKVWARPDARSPGMG
jgi:hypothetical protein